MTRIVPHDKNYRPLETIKKSGKIILYASAIISLAVILIDKLDLIKPKEPYVNSLNSVLGILALLYFALSQWQSYLFLDAEIVRKNDFIDNAFRTNLSVQKSEGYFSNENISPGIYKLGVNCFENSFFTKNISGKMIATSVIYSVIISVLFLLVIFYTDQSTIISIIKISLPFQIMQQTIRLLIFHYQVKNIFNKFNAIFTTTEKDKRESLIIDNVVGYEKTLSWGGGVSTNSKLFNKLNPSLTAQWEELKKKLTL